MSHMNAITKDFCTLMLSRTFYQTDYEEGGEFHQVAEWISAAYQLVVSTIKWLAVISTVS